MIIPRRFRTEKDHKPDVNDILYIMRHVVDMCSSFVPISYKQFCLCEGVTDPPTSPTLLTFDHGIDNVQVMETLHTNFSYSTHPSFLERPSIMTKQLFVSLIRPTQDVTESVNYCWNEMNQSTWRGSPETKSDFRSVKDRFLRIVESHANSLSSDPNLLMVNREYLNADIYTKKKTPIEMHIGEFNGNNNGFTHIELDNLRSYIHPGFISSIEPIRMFKGITLLELTQMEQPHNMPDYSPITVSMTEEAIEDESDFCNHPWRSKPMILTRERLSEFILLEDHAFYLFEKWYGTHRDRNTNPLFYWIVYKQIREFRRYLCMNAQFDFFVNDLYLAIDSDEKRKVLIQCSLDEWEDECIHVQDSEFDFNEIEGFTRFYWCETGGEE